MAKRIIVGVIAAIVVVILIWLHGIPIAIASALLALGVQYELTKTIKLSGVRIVEPVTYGYTALALPAYYFFGLPGVFLLLTLAVILVFVCDVVFKKYNFDNTMASVFTLIYPQIFFIFLYMVILVEDKEVSRLILSATIACSVCTDTFAYFIGSFFGKHKLCPIISPNKTIEGAVGGIFGGIIGVIVVALFFDQGRIHLIEYAVLAFIMSCVSQIGDLSASLIKRRYGVKDFASVLPGHGGLLDRIDSLLFILPIAFTFYYLYLGLGIGGVL